MKKIVLTFAGCLLSFFIMAQDGITVGTKAPEFTGTDQKGKTVKLSEALKKGKVVVIFYRGNWCPNCTRELSNIQDSLSFLKEQNITVIGVGPETTPGVAKTVEKTRAAFPVISDKGLKIMTAYKVAFKVTAGMDKVHRKFNIDVTGNNGANGNILPRPSAFIIEQNGIIIYRYFNNSSYDDPDSNNRITVSEILEKSK
ncbi:MAG: redoxin domain-containing protein [Ferruginibacter sp.]|nr:redoxin domain-containing protein [Ferruginibacter sp.]